MIKSLLIIEDEPLLGSELQRHYSKLGWEAEWAKSLQEARQMLDGRSIDPMIILSDMSLPDGNALDLMESLRATGNHSEWIFLTGYGSVPGFGAGPAHRCLRVSGKTL